MFVLILLMIKLYRSSKIQVYRVVEFCILPLKRVRILYFEVGLIKVP